MQSEILFDNIIKSTLNKEVDNLNTAPGTLDKIKAGLSSEASQSKTFSNRKLVNPLLILKSGFNKPAYALLSAVLVLTLTLTFFQPARAFAQEVISEISSMVYVVVKGDSGKYEPIQMPAEKVTFGSASGEQTLLSDDELEKLVGFEIKVPSALAGGYTLDRTLLYEKDDTDKKFVSKHYSNSSSASVILDISTDDKLFNSVMDFGDNIKKLSLVDKFLYYYECPLPVYPEVNGKTDFTQKPLEIKVPHSLTWEHNGVYYNLSDVGIVSLSMDELLEVAKSILNQ
ncbi:MAG: DUF4367 domain-containing protein [Clostridia bacterium]|nr:DUF4367 domain-containing protein [Clostridia bacterium]